MDLSGAMSSPPTLISCSGTVVMVEAVSAGVWEHRRGHRRGQKPQHRNGSSAGHHRRPAQGTCGLPAQSTARQVGGKANDIAHQVGRTGDICYHLILFCSGLCGLGFLCVGGQGAQAGQQHRQQERMRKNCFFIDASICVFQVKLTVLQGLSRTAAGGKSRAAACSTLPVQVIVLK